MSARIVVSEGWWWDYCMKWPTVGMAFGRWKANGKGFAPLRMKGGTSRHIVGGNEFRKCPVGAGVQGVTGWMVGVHLS
eukprot:scaffold417814_cov62-Attheya_sp.AAC.1